MALKIWLPLDGSLRNLGTEGNITITTQGNPTIIDDGKIGQCYNFNGDTITIPSFDSTRSICFWLKTNKTNSTIAFVDYKSKLGFGFQANGYIIPNCSGVSLKMYDPSNFIDNSWNHIALTRDESLSDVKLYLNGTLQTKRSSGNNYWTNNVDGCYLGGRSTGTYMNCCINDFRVYDHCLSALEVKELSQGLVLHYKLDGLLGGVGENIILTNSDFSNGTIGWSNWATVQSREIIAIEDKKWAHIVKTANKYGGYSREITIKPNTIYTVSATFYASGATKGILWWHYRSSEGGANLSQNMKSFDLTTTPQRYSAQIPIYTNNNYTVDRLNLMIGTPTESFGNVNIYFTDIKIEEGLFDTGYIQSIDELGIDTTKIYDSSGYGNDGILTGILETSNDTSKYQLSSFFNGIDTAIQIPYNATVWQDNFTINLWFKKNELGSKNYETLIGGPSGFEMDTRAGSATTLSFYMASVRGGNVYSPFNFGEWYMVTLVNNGINELYYVNGNLVKTIEKKSMPTGNYFIGAWQTKAKQNYKGEMSDFRIYATALDEKAIKKLYNTPTEIDKNHNYHTMELDEIANDISVKKNGKTKAKVFSETTNNNTFFKNGTVNGHFIIEK